MELRTITDIQSFLFAENIRDHRTTVQLSHEGFIRLQEAES
jgi:hypothetical protein